VIGWGGGNKRRLHNPGNQIQLGNERKSETVAEYEFKKLKPLLKI
jgi:hypothetical protein